MADLEEVERTLAGLVEAIERGELDASAADRAALSRALDVVRALMGVA